MSAHVDHTRRTYFIYNYDEPEEDNTGATVSQFPEDWQEVEERSSADNDIQS